MSARKSDLLSAHARAEIDGWITRYPADRKQSAVLAALREVLGHRVIVTAMYLPLYSILTQIA